MHASFKQELDLMKGQEQSGENLLTFLKNLEYRERSLNKSILKNDFKESMFGDLKVITENVLLKLER